MIHSIKYIFNNTWAKSSLKFCWILYLYDGIIFLRDIVFLLRILYSDAATGISLPKRRCTNNLAFRWFNSVTKNINLSAVTWVEGKSTTKQTKEYLQICTFIVIYVFEVLFSCFLMGKSKHNMRFFIWHIAFSEFNC